MGLGAEFRVATAVAIAQAFPSERQRVYVRGNRGVAEPAQGCHRPGHDDPLSSPSLRRKGQRRPIATWSMTLSAIALSMT